MNGIVPSPWLSSNTMNTAVLPWRYVGDEVIAGTTDCNH